MSKTYGSNQILAFSYSLARYCLIVVTVGPICQTTAIDPITVECVTLPFVVGDCPLWIDETNSVYFVDTFQRKAIYYRPDPPLTVEVQLEPVGILKLLVPVKSNEPVFAIGHNNRLSVFKWDGQSTDPIWPYNSVLISDDENEAVECGKGDINGRLWVGTSNGKLYMVDKFGTATVKLHDIGVPGGLVWSLDNKLLYYSDTSHNTIVAVKFDSVKGNLIGVGKEIFNFKTQNITGIPSGMTVDNLGHLWIACETSSSIVKIDPIAGTFLQQVDVPDASSITSVEFGFPSLEHLYLTTVENTADISAFPKSGSLFRVINTGSTGNGVSRIDVSWPKQGH